MAAPPGHQALSSKQCGSRCYTLDSNMLGNTFENTNEEVSKPGSKEIREKVGVLGNDSK